MRISFIKTLAGLALCGPVGVLPGVAAAENGKYPEKPIHIIVPFAAGGTTDILIRTISPLLAKDLGQPVIIENKGGAGSVIGTTAGAQAKPDGYTFVMGSSAMSINASFVEKLPYDTAKLIAVAPVALTPYFLMVSAGLKVDTVPALVSAAKQSPGKIAYATTGPGNSPHLGAAQFEKASGVELLHVAYKGTSHAMQDLVAGHVHLMFVGLPTAMPHIESSRLKVLAVASDKRVPMVPHVPTLAEVGGPDFNLDSWFGVMAPHGTPMSMVRRVSEAIRAAVERPEIQERYRAMGAVPMLATQQEFADYVAEDIKMYRDFITANPDVLKMPS